MAKAKVKLSLFGLTIPQKIAFARMVVTQSTASGHLPNPTMPTLAAINAATNVLDEKFQAAEALRQESQTATADQNTAEAALDALLTQFGNFVEIATDGNEAKILSTGLSVRAPNTPIGDLPQVENLAVSVGDDAGELDAQWDRVRGAKTYRIETSPDPITPTSWTLADIVTRSKATLSGLTSGTKYWVRVAAIGAAGQGPWSDPATKIAP